MIRLVTFPVVVVAALGSLAVCQRGDSVHAMILYLLALILVKPDAYALADWLDESFAPVDDPE